MLAGSRRRDLCRALVRYWSSTQAKKSDLCRILRTALYRASCKWGARPVLLISTAPVWSPCVSLWDNFHDSKVSSYFWNWKNSKFLDSEHNTWINKSRVLYDRLEFFYWASICCYFFFIAKACNMRLLKSFHFSVLIWIF